MANEVALPHGWLQFNDDNTEITVYNEDGDIVGEYFTHRRHSHHEQSRPQTPRPKSPQSRPQSPQRPQTPQTPQHCDPQPPHCDNQLPEYVRLLIDSINLNSLALNNVVFAQFYQSSLLVRARGFTEASLDQLNKIYDFLNRVNQLGGVGLNITNLGIAIGKTLIAINGAKAALLAIDAAIANPADQTAAVAALTNLNAAVTSLQSSLTLLLILG